MRTPIADFVNEYVAKNTIRMHMPGHKGVKHLGAEGYDITEVKDADVLYHAEGIIAESEANAAAIFGTARTLYSTEGSSLCIRAMLMLVTMLARSRGRQRAVIAAGRNAHKTFITAAGLMDTDVRWMYGTDNGIVSCALSTTNIEDVILKYSPDAVYITSPDYLGNMADISAIADVCHRHGCLFLVDNAHGAYLAVRERQEATIYGESQEKTSASRHPIAIGADLCCDSAHKTLPVLTGGAYLHISHNAPDICCEAAEQAMSMFATTSPSYLILQSLDLANRLMTESMPAKLATLEERTARLKHKLTAAGWVLVGDESIKLTISAKPCGYTGDELADILREHNIEPEFSDPDFLVLMLSTDTSNSDIESLEAALLKVKRRPAIQDKAPNPKPGITGMSIRDALFSLSETIPISEAKGRILAEPGVTCPPAVPIAVCGEIIDDNAIACFKYYGIDKLKAVKTE